MLPLRRGHPLAAAGLQRGDQRRARTAGRDHIVDVLTRVGGNKAKAAKILGLDRRSLYRRLELYSIGAITRRLV